MGSRQMVRWCCLRNSRQIATKGRDLDDLLKRAGKATDSADALVESLNDITSPRAHEIHESCTGRFGERLSLAVTHALRSDLASRLPSYAITLARSADAPSRQIMVNVDAFDVWPTGRCVLVADWTILDADRRTLLSADRGTFTTAGAGANPGDAAVVMAMAEAVRQLADRIASTADALPAPAAL